jgi:phospholipid/cholesterol/gamma-HCH transport system substrate-binding protein
MKTKGWQKELKVGITVIIGLILLSIMLIKASNWRFGSGGRTVKIHFDYVGGLLKNAPVHMYGVKIGKVESIQLVEDKVEVTVYLEKDEPIREGYSILIDILGLVGEKYIEIINGPAGNPVTTEHTLKGINPISVGQVMMKANEITEKTLNTIDFMQEFISTNEREIQAGAVKLRDFTIEARDMLRETSDNVNVLLTRINRLAETTEGDIDETMKSLKTFAVEIQKDRENLVTQIEEVMEDIEHILADTKPVIKESSGNIQQVSGELLTSTRKANQYISDLNESLSQLLEQLGDITDYSDEKLQEGLENFVKSSDDLKEISGKIDSLVTQIESGQGTLGKLITEEDGYEDLAEAITAGRSAVEDLSRATRSIDRRLKFFENIHTAKQYELSYDRSSGSLQNQFKISLPRFEPYYYAAGLSVREDKLVYDLQLGRRFGDFIPWVGSIRSKSSIGLDYWPFADRFGISLQSVDVIDKEPEWDLDFALKLYGGWYFILGARDLAGSEIGLNFGLRAVLED